MSIDIFPDTNVTMPEAPPSPKQNRLLAALPHAEYQRLLPHLELVSLKLGTVLYESGAQLQHVYFPLDCIISLLYVMENGSSAEIAFRQRQQYAAA